MRKQRQAFSREFKLEAVRLMEEGKKPPAELARELGLRRNQLYKWKEKTDKDGGNAFAGAGRRLAADAAAEENARLKHELSKVKEENEILKKAAAFFAREL
ncbi:MAG: transposase, partial [Deltaproteobacteria bacterium]|nr:transposase [Deltaproteobacteria bacterium]